MGSIWPALFFKMLFGILFHSDSVVISFLFFQNKGNNIVFFTKGSIVMVLSQLKAKTKLTNTWMWVTESGAKLEIEPLSCSFSVFGHLSTFQSLHWLNFQNLKLWFLTGTISRETWGQVYFEVFFINPKFKQPTLSMRGQMWRHYFSWQ